MKLTYNIAGFILLAYAIWFVIYDIKYFYWFGNWGRVLLAIAVLLFSIFISHIFLNIGKAKLPYNKLTNWSLVLSTLGAIIHTGSIVTLGTVCGGDFTCMSIQLFVMGIIALLLFIAAIILLAINKRRDKVSVQ